MSEIRYMISDAARQAGVEAHVLRSWEEELDIKVGRTELGHRYYTDKTIYIMKKVKELRDKGFQLKAIKVLIPEIQKKAEDKDIFFQVELPEKIICEHDKNWMCEAFYNVFDNAVKYSKSNSTIDITMKQTEMFYKIQIRDYGIGIKDGEENKIFQRFYRGEQARGQEGCGIGLYLSREIVLLQKGIMKATQMKPGLLIEVNLPV